jgi:hypothetical protein
LLAGWPALWAPIFPRDTGRRRSSPLSSRIQDPALGPTRGETADTAVVEGEICWPPNPKSASDDRCSVGSGVGTQGSDEVEGDEGDESDVGSADWNEAAATTPNTCADCWCNTCADC